MRNISDKICREIRNTHFVSNRGFFVFENGALYEIMWNNIVEPDMSYCSVAHAHSMLDSYGYRHTLGICTICFFLNCNNGCTNASTMSCYVQCLPCYEQKHKYRCAAGDIGVQIPVEKDLLLSNPSDRLRNKPCLYSVGIFPGVKRPVHEADQ